MKDNIQPAGLEAEVYEKCSQKAPIPSFWEYSVGVKITDPKVMKQPLVIYRPVTKQDFNDLNVGDTIIINPLRARKGWYSKRSGGK